MLQNNMMQLMTVVAMEPPARFEVDAVCDENVKALRAVRPAVGYRDEPNVPHNSTTETYGAAKFYIEANRLFDREDHLWRDSA